MRITEIEGINYGWNVRRTIDNATIHTMTDSQHRTISMLAYYKHMFERNVDTIFNGNNVGLKIYSNFFLKSLPIMLRTAGLPELNLQRRFTEYDAEAINSDVESYLKYIDRKFGTWYAPMAA